LAPVVDMDKSSRNRPRKNVPPREKCSPSGNVASELSSGFHKVFKSPPVQFLCRDHRGRKRDRAIIFPSACQITGSTSSAAPSKTSVVTSALLKNIVGAA